MEHSVDKLSVIFAVVVTVLAALACIGALAVVLVREWYALRDTIRRHRPHPPIDPTGRWWRERGAFGVPERRP
jgi:hypothetical protein